MYSIDRIIKAHGCLRLSAYSGLTAMFVWFVLRQAVNLSELSGIMLIIAAVFAFLSVFFCIAALVLHWLRARSMTLGEAKRYLLTYAHRYDLCPDADIKNAVDAICVMSQAGLLSYDEETDHKSYGSVPLDTAPKPAFTRKQTINRETKHNNGNTENCSDRTNPAEPYAEVFSLDDMETDCTYNNDTAGKAAGKITEPKNRKLRTVRKK